MIKIKIDWSGSAILLTEVEKEIIIFDAHKSNPSEKKLYGSIKLIFILNPS